MVEAVVLIQNDVGRWDPVTVPENAAREILRLREELEQTKQEASRMANVAGKVRVNLIEAVDRTRPLCPDHRDKASGYHCLLCELELRTRAAKQLRHRMEQAGLVLVDTLRIWPWLQDEEPAHGE